MLNSAKKARVAASRKPLGDKFHVVAAAKYPAAPDLHFQASSRSGF